MRYSLESTLPINAFSPRGGRGPFTRGMTLEGGGGGGGGVFSGITDSISSALGTDGGGGGLMGALASFDKSVSKSIPNGWSGIGEMAAVAAATYFGGPLAGGAVRAGFDYTHGGEQRSNALRNGAITAAVAYAAQGVAQGLSSTGAEGSIPSDNPAGTSGYGEANETLNSNVSQTPSGNYITDNSVPYTPDGSTPTVPEAPTPEAPTPEAPPTAPEVPPPTPNTPAPPTYTDPVTGLPVTVDPALGITNEYLNAANPTIAPETLAASANPSIDPSQLSPAEKLKLLIEQNAKDPLLNASTNTPATIHDFSTPADAATEAMVKTGTMDRLAQMPGAAYDMAKSYISNNPWTSAGLGLAAYKMLGAQGQQPTGQPTGSSSSSNPTYYGTASGMGEPYLLKNRINASNIYDHTASTRRYAKGGEVQHFGIGGIADTLTKWTQPIEKAVLRPLGEIPGVKQALPYAGLFAAPFIASPMAAAGVGALASGFGNPGSGFNLKRAIMGGIASYGLSNIGSGLEAAGGGSGTTPSTEGMGSIEEPLPKGYGKSDSFFRSPEAMGKGVSNLMGGSTYDQAATAFGTKAGMGSAGAALMGTTGMMGVDEAEKQLKTEKAAGAISDATYQEQMNRIAAAKASAEKAIKEHPYQFAMGGEVNPPDDQTGMDNGSPVNFGFGGVSAMNYALGGDISTPTGMNVQQNNMRYATGGNVNAAVGAPRFLSGGGDGMSDSIQATIGGKREARLADGEFVVPADVVSGLGNGSSKAGANQLYAMMDRVRKSRTGTTKQGKQINPQKVLKV